MAPGPTRSRSVLYVIGLTFATLLTFARVVTPVRSQIQERVAALDRFGGRLASPAGNAVGKALNYEQLKKENARLVDELDKARASSSRYDDAVRQRDELLKLNDLEGISKFASKNARVVGSGLNNLEETLTIDVGSDDGIRVDLPVVSAAGLVGRVVSVSKKHASVAVITDPQISVGVRIARSGEVAVTRGQHRGEPLRLDLVALDVKVSKGDVVVTSGLSDSRFPPEIPVGRVKSVKPGSILQEVTLTPIVDLERISFVKVLLTSGRS